MLRTKADAEERGEDVEREKNWEWTIEDNENWERKLARKARRADFEFHGKSSPPFPLFPWLCSLLLRSHFNLIVPSQFR